MRFRDCDELLQARLDGPGRGAVEAHLAECASCRELHAAAELLEAGLRALPRPTPPPGLADRIVAQALAEAPHRLAWRQRWQALAAAAALLAAPALALWLSPRTEVAPTVVAVRTSQEPPAAPKDEPAPSLRQSVEQAGTAVASLTDRLADRTREQAQWLWAAAAPADLPPMNPMSAPDPATTLDPAAGSLRQAGEGVTVGLETVTAPARRAFAYFARELPTLEPGARTVQ
jgi:hypothetical protein